MTDAFARRLRTQRVEVRRGRAGTTGEMPPEVLYVAAFVVGFWDGLFIRMLPDLGFKKKETRDENQARGKGK